MKAMSLRLSDEQHQGLQVVCLVSGRSLTAEIRVAIDAYIARRKLDPEFQRRLAEYRAEQLAIMDGLAS